MQTRKSLMLGAAGTGALLFAAATAWALGAQDHDPMAMFDKDGSRTLSLAEVRQGAQTIFGKVDANKDGRVTAEEFQAHHRAKGHGRGPHGGKHGGPEGRDEGPPRGPMHMDQDGDGAVSLAEMQGALEAHFNRADANRDGSVSREEMEAAHRAMRDHG